MSAMLMPSLPQECLFFKLEMTIQISSGLISEMSKSISGKIVLRRLLVLLGLVRGIKVLLSILDAILVKYSLNLSRISFGSVIEAPSMLSSLGKFEDLPALVPQIFLISFHVFPGFCPAS